MVKYPFKPHVLPLLFRTTKRFASSYPIAALPCSFPVAPCYIEQEVGCADQLLPGVFLPSMPELNTSNSGDQGCRVAIRNVLFSGS